jgi:hypothetical protein
MLKWVCFKVWIVHELDCITSETILIFISPCIVIYSYSTTNKMYLLSQIIYSRKTLYMFQTGFSSIIRSSKLRIQQRYMSNGCCYLLLAAAVWHIPLLYTQFRASDDRRKDSPKHAERFTRINNLRLQVHLVGCTIGIASLVLYSCWRVRIS